MKMKHEWLDDLSDHDDITDLARQIHGEREKLYELETQLESLAMIRLEVTEAHEDFPALQDALEELIDY